MMAKKARPRRRSFALADERRGLSLRVSRRVRELLEAASRQSGRSLSQEAELRLEQALQDERSFQDNLDYVFGSQGAALLGLIGFLMRQEGDWLDEPLAYATMRRRIELILDAAAPAGEARAADSAADADVMRLLRQLFSVSPNAVWFRWHLYLRERLGNDAVGRIARWLAARPS